MKLSIMLEARVEKKYMIIVTDDMSASLPIFQFTALDIMVQNSTCFRNNVAPAVKLVSANYTKT